ncbi:hypothetical protein [Phaeodactylibacter xiamenensis]|uniref:hypothetical protein n=1 Tax=Phaeodactylibacter xiamenensis TaxID=1524460 RepID=UPI001BD204CF|nr:PQQ-like beta-propeller repeat protein [Trichodesmium erythraeum GBRTRLIN201]
MELIHKIENSNIGIHIDSSRIIYKHEINVIEFDLKKLTKKVIFESDFKTHTIEKRNDSIFLISGKGYEHYQNELIQSYEYTIGDYSIKEDQYLFVSIDYDFDKYLGKSGCVDVFSNKIIWEGDYGDQLRSDKGNTFSVSQTKLIKRNILTGNKEWEYIFPKTTYWPSIYIGRNYVLLAISERDLLICLDTQNGEIKWEQTTIPKGIVIDENEDTFHQFMINYNCFNLNDGSLVRQKNDREYFRDIRIENQKDNYIQLGNALLINDSTTKTTGKFNIDNLKFEWTEKGLNIPQGYRMRKNDEYVFLVDSNKKLSIYKWKTR